MKLLENRNMTAGITAAFIVAACALILTAYLIVDFYLDTAHDPPGSEIRPMGLAAFLGFSALLSILAGGGFALYAVVALLIRRRWAQCGYALLAFGATWLPYFAGRWGFDYVVALRRLVLED